MFASGFGATTTAQAQLRSLASQPGFVLLPLSFALLPLSFALSPHSDREDFFACIYQLQVRVPTMSDSKLCTYYLTLYYQTIIPVYH